MQSKPNSAAPDLRMFGGSKYFMNCQQNWLQSFACLPQICFTQKENFLKSRKKRDRPETAKIKGKNEETTNTTDAEC